MSVPTISFPTKNFMKSVLKFSENVHYQTSPGDLVLDTLRLGEGVLNDTGPGNSNRGVHRTKPKR